MKKTKEEAAQTRRAVLEAAVKSFGERGYSSTSLEAVAKEAGMTRGAIYWHFKNKYELLDAVIQHTYEKLKVRVEKVLRAPLSPLKKVRQLIYEFLVISEEEEYRVIEEIMVFKTETSQGLKRIYTNHMDKVKEMRELMIELIRKGIEVGEFDGGLNPETVVLAWISYVGGVKSAWLSDLETFSLRESAESLADIFITGIARRG